MLKHQIIFLGGKFIGFIIIFSTYYHVTIYLAFACDQQQYCIHIRCLNKIFLLLTLIQVRIIMLIKDDFCCLAILSNHFVICFLFQSKAIVGYFPQKFLYIFRISEYLKELTTYLNAFKKAQKHNVSSKA